jgi:hypothetical protein
MTRQANERFYIHSGWMFGGILVLAIGLRLYELGRNPLWYDEVAYAHISRDLPADVFFCRGILTSPIFCALLFVWQKLGTSDIWMRMHAVLFGAGIVALSWRLGNQLANRWGAAFAALLAAVSPFLLYYSRDAKMYAFVAFLELSLAILVIVYGASSQIRLGVLSLYCIVAILVLYVHLTSPFFLAALNIAYLLFYVRDFKKTICWGVAQLIVLVGAIPFLVAHHNFATLMESRFFWAPPPDAESLLESLFNLSTGYSSIRWVSVCGAIGVIGLFVTALAFAPQSRKHLLFLAALSIGNALIVFSYSRHSHYSVFVDRYLIGSSVVLPAICGCGLAVLPQTWLRSIVCALLLCVFSFSIHDLYIYRFAKQQNRHMGVYRTYDARAMRDFIREFGKPGDVVWHPSWTTLIQLRWYLPEYEHVFSDMAGQMQHKLDDQSPRSEQALYNLNATDIEDAIGTGKRVWLVLQRDFPQITSRYAGIQSWLDSHGKKVVERAFNGRYARSYVCLYEAARLIDKPPAERLETTFEANNKSAQESADIMLKLNPAVTNAQNQPSLSVISSSTDVVDATYQVVSGSAIARAAYFERPLGAASQWLLRPYTSLQTNRMAMYMTVRPETDSNDVLKTFIDLPQGKYDIFMERVVQGGKVPFATSLIRIELEGASFESSGKVDPQNGGWGWERLGVFDKNGGLETPMVISARDIDGRPESFAVISRILFKKACGAENVQNVVPESGTLSIKPGGDEQIVLKTIPQDGFLEVSVSSSIDSAYVWMVQKTL